LNHFFCGGIVKGTCGLIRYHHLGLVNHRSRNGHSLLLTTAEFIGEPILFAVKAD
jgi:hypothetical protein